MNMSQAIFKAITENVDVQLTANFLDFVILAPKALVRRDAEFYPGKAIVQIQGGQGQELDFLRTIKAYDKFVVEKGDPVRVTVDGKDQIVKFHHFYAAHDDIVRFIAYDEEGNQIHRDINCLTGLL